jgi:predicted nucleic acid-binding protein
MRPDKHYATNRLLSRFVPCDLDREITECAGDLMRQSPDRRVALEVPDAIIAGAALARGLTLVTLNPADCEGIPGPSLALLPEEDAP